MLALTTLSWRWVALVVASSFLHVVKPIITRVWMILFLLQNFRLLISKEGGADNLSDAVILLQPIFIGIGGLVILIPSIIFGNKVLRRYILRGLNRELKWKHSLLFQLLDFLWTHLICISIFLYLMEEVRFYVISLYFFVVTFCSLFTKLITWYRGAASNLITDLFFKNVGFGLYLLTASIYIVLVESFHLSLIQIFTIIMVPRLMLSASAKTMIMYSNNNGLMAIKERLQKPH